MNRNHLLQSNVLNMSIFVLILFGWTSVSRAVPLPGGTLDPTTIPKYAATLAIPGKMPKAPVQADPNSDYYEIAARQFKQQMLPSGLPPTNVWGYGAPNDATSFHYPSNTVEAISNRPVIIKWRNDLKDRRTGNFLPHLFSVDQTLHWANPAGPRDSRGTDPTPYLGPIPMVTHLHGAHVGPESDGYPEAWFLPNAKNIPQGFFKAGSRFNQFDNTNKEPGTAVYRYPNDQRAATLWFHDHALGMTRLNIYAGLAGFYMIRGGSGDLPAGILPSGSYEVPLIIQDKSFNKDGSLFFPDSRAFFDGFAGPFIPDPTSDMSPIWNPEFFGNTMVVNGKTWPFMNVEPRKYRFRLLNASNARTLILQLDNANVGISQIGSDGGFLPAPVSLNQLLIAPAERADIIVDFTNLRPGTRVTLLNVGPDSPYGGGIFDPSDPGTTGQVMQFRVVALKKKDTSRPVSQLVLPAISPMPVTNDPPRKVSLNELDSALLPGIGPMAAMLGTMEFDSSMGMLMPMHKMWSEPITENPRVGATEVWEIHNFTMDAHPIHLHLVEFQVVERQGMDMMGVPMGAPRPPEAWESGLKDTALAYPGEILRIRANFDKPGRYVWHCHIIDHEDNEMMRPMCVGTPGVDCL